MIKTAQHYREIELNVKNIDWSNNSKLPQSLSSKTKLSSEATTAPRIKMEPMSQQSSNSSRKRKFNDSSDFSDRKGHQFDKKFGPLQSESESESDSDSECLTDGLTCVRINSAEENVNEEDPNEFIEKLIEYERFDEIHLINVFEKLEFFKEFEVTVKNQSVVSMSVGVNQLTQRAPIIGLSTLVKQMRKDDDDIGSYNCTFDDDKFVAVISLCLSPTEVYYLNMQSETNDDEAITFDMKIKFLVDLFHMKQMTVVMYDAKEQLKVLLKCIPQLRTFCVRLRDPLVANWLLDPDGYGNLLTLVSFRQVIITSQMNRLHLFYRFSKYFRFDNIHLVVVVLRTSLQAQELIIGTDEASV